MVGRRGREGGGQGERCEGLDEQEQEESEPFIFFASFLPLEQGRRRAYQEPRLEAAMRAIRSHYLDSG